MGTRVEPRSAIALFLGIFALTSTPVASAQHVADNAVVSAQDAFGLTIGTDSLGLYDTYKVRGFSPQDAGNVRIGGLYFDQQAPLSQRVLEGSTIRVGMSAGGYAFPAPTGIADFELRHTGDKPALSALMGAGPFQTHGIDIDGRYPFLSLNLRVPIGVSFRVNADFPGYTSRILSVGAAPEWKPNEHLAVRAFFDLQRNTQAKVVPEFFVAAANLPPHIPSTYLGQTWADGESRFENYGAILNAELSERWTLNVGLFRSTNQSETGYSDLYFDTRSSGVSNHVLIGYPRQGSHSNSGEVRLTGRITEGTLSHEAVFSLRGRDALALYDGADVRPAGTVLAGQNVQIRRPNFVFGPLSRDENTLLMAGLAYHIGWKHRAELSMGLQRADYRKIVDAPGELTSRRSDQPWRSYGVATISLPPNATLYAGYTQGIEDSGIAPSNATNRGEILPATRTWQRDAGVQYALTPKVKMIAGVFDVHKPYFNLDAGNLYVNLGNQDHRGFEFSIAGEFFKDLNIVGGWVTLNPKVTANGNSAIAIGPRAVGQSDHVAQLNLDYKFQSLPALSFHVTGNSEGRQTASLDNSISVAGTQTIDCGARYQFILGNSPASLHLWVQNAGNSYHWMVTESGGFMPGPRRNMGLYLTVDL
jgi:iron complex outermembrane receptor protein